jgi:hypothetical protein
MFTKPQTLGAGDWLARDEIGAKLGASTTILQSTGALTNPSLIRVGRVLVPDLGNLRGETPVGAIAAGGVLGNRSGLGGVVSDLGDLATWVLPATLAEARRRCGVVVNQDGTPGGPVVLQLAGPTRVLCSSTVALMQVGTRVAIEVGGNNGRGTVRPAATIATPNQETVVGVVLDVPRNTAGVATDAGTAADGAALSPLFCVVDFFGLGSLVTGLLT